MHRAIRRSTKLFAVAAALALGMVSLASCQPPNTPTADYQFNGNRKACGNDAPELTTLGTTSFGTQSVDGKSWKVQQFGDNSGLRLAPTTGEVGSGVYTVALLVKFTENQGYDRILEFKNGTGDPGLYQYYGSLYFWPRDLGTGTEIGTNFAQVVLTRASNGQVRGYVDGNLKIEFTDTAQEGVISSANVLRFFQDNTSNGSVNEDGPGAVARIRLWNKVLTPSEVNGLDQLPNSPCSTT
jgi:Concanavalin A-like lectin/glucanases superfamily